MKKETLALVLICIGIALFALASLDLISIIVSVLEIIFQTDLQGVFLSSFWFRFLLIVIGGVFTLIGGLMYKDIKDS